MTIEALLKVVPPPAEAGYTFAGPWNDIERLIGTPLPQDYKDFARLYGSGAFMDFVRVAIPRTPEPGASLESEVWEMCHIFAEDEDFPYVVWPTRHGVLPFGSTYDGDSLCWLTVGPPEAWPIIVWGRHEDYEAPCEMVDCDLTGFLAGLATGEIRPKAFSPAHFETKATFEPWSFSPASD